MTSDKDPPKILSCPVKVEVSTGDVETAVHWDEPLFDDNSKRPLRVKQVRHHSVHVYSNDPDNPFLREMRRTGIITNTLFIFDD